MNKSELKNGAIVETREGNRYIKIDNTLMYLDMSGRFLNLNNYTDELLINSLYSYARIFDIVKVNNNVEDSYYKGMCNNAVSEVYFEKKWTWERSE